MRMYSKKRHIIIITMLFQLIVIAIFNTSLLIIDSIEVHRNNVPLINFIIILCTFLSIKSMKEVDNLEKKEYELELMKINMENTEELINILHSQRHEYLTHIQAIQAMVYLEEYFELADYLKGITKDYRITSEMIKIGHPALTSLINVKREIANRKKIEFTVNCKNRISNISVESSELCSILSNLLDNAIEEASTKDFPGFVQVDIDYIDEKIFLMIENTGEINETIIDRIWEPGISCKNSIERGYGLYIVKKIINKYNGTINFMNTENGTVKFIVELQGE